MSVLALVLGEMTSDAANMTQYAARLSARIRNGWISESDETTFKQRLAWFVEVAAGKSVLALEPVAPILLPAAYRRMLERLALGYGASVITYDQEWLFGSQEIFTPGLPPLAVHYGALGAWPVEPGKITLLVGDRPGPGWSARRPNWPFISSLRNGCSYWLAEKLEDAGIPESELCWVNAYQRDGTPTNAAPLRDAPFKRVVALGRNAGNWCEENCLAESIGDFAQVHHPQYWKRLKDGKTYILPRTIQRGQQ